MFALNFVLVVLDFCVYEFVCFLSLSSFGGLRGILFMFSDIFTFWFSFLSFCFWLFLLFFRYFCLLNLFILLLYYCLADILGFSFGNFMSACVCFWVL